MNDKYKLLLILIFTSIMSLLLTEVVRYISIKIGAVDEPNERRVNTKPTATAGGLSIYISFFISTLLLLPINKEIIIPIFLSSTIVVFTGFIDDIRDISAKMKMGGILAGGLIIYFIGDLKMSMVALPFIGEIQLGVWSLPITLLWIAAITNSINLIDGLDGLATGVSTISLFTIGIMAFFFLNADNITIASIIIVLAFACIGFLPANYYPAKIYLGDTGSLFLGFMLSILSLYGLKHVTFLSLIVPLVILALPIGDTLYAIIRRILNNQRISTADNQHIHHRIMALGFTHKQTVKLLYAITLTFSIIALLYPVSTTLGSILLTIGLIIILQLSAELLGLLGSNNRPLISIFKKILKAINKPGDINK